MKILRKLGKDLKVGDIIHVWWSNNRQAVRNRETIAKLVVYNGPLAYLWADCNGKPRLADFAENKKLGMTIEPQLLYTVYV